MVNATSFFKGLIYGAGWFCRSGRRDFGEFSVYNPVKKETIASTNLTVASGIELLMEDRQE